MPADLKDRLDTAAQEHRRSLTAEIVARLQDTDGGELAEAKGIINALLAELVHLKYPDARGSDREELERALRWPTAEHHARLFLAGAPIRQLQEVPSLIRLLRGLPTHPGLEDSDRQRLDREITLTIDALLKPVINYLRSQGWDVSPPPSD